MNHRLQLLIIICVVAIITVVISHGMIAWLKIETKFGDHWVTGLGSGRPSVFMAGSSLAGDGLSWQQISNSLHMIIEGWGVAGSSPAEWEVYQHQVSQPQITVIVVSVYDLNEYFISDFRAELVPFRQTIKDLSHSSVDWPFYKRLITMYPLTYLRILYPTLGRSGGVMVGLREKFRKMVKPFLRIDTEAGPTLSLNENAENKEYKKEKISDWAPDRMLRRLAGLRGSCHGIHVYNGPKKLALLRMMQYARENGRVIVVVLPVSPAYAREFLTPEIRQDFEKALIDSQKRIPQALWIRLDQFNKLDSNEFFWDLVHMNSNGQKIATESFLEQIKNIMRL